MQPVGQLHEQHADIARGGEDELLEVLGLDQCTRRIAAGDFRQLGDAVHQVRNVLPEQAADLIDRDIGVLDHIMQQAGDDGGLVELEVGEQAGDSDRMGEIRIARMAQLLAVLHDREDVGLVEFVFPRVWLVRLDQVYQFVLT